MSDFQYRDGDGSLVTPYQIATRSRRVIETVKLDLNGSIVSTESVVDGTFTTPKVTSTWVQEKTKYTEEPTAQKIAADFAAAKAAIYPAMVSAWNAIQVFITATGGNVYGPLPLDPTRRGANNDGYMLWATTVGAGGTAYDLQLEGIDGAPVTILAADVQTAFADFMRQFTVLNNEWNTLIAARDAATQVSELPTVVFNVEPDPR